MSFYWADIGAMSVASLLAAVLVAYLWQFRQEPSVPLLSWSMGAVFLWSATVVAELQFQPASLHVRYLLVTVKAFAILGFVSALFILAVRNREQYPAWRRKALAVLSVVPLLTLIAVLLPESWHWYRYDFHLRPHRTGAALTWDRGPWQVFVYGYTYLLAFTSIGLLAAQFWGAGRRARRSVLLTAASWALPFAVDFLSKVGLIPMQVDPVAYGLGLAVAVTAWGVLHEGIVQVGPFARRNVLEAMEDLLFVLDRKDRLTDCNRIAAKALGGPAGGWLWRQPADLPEPWPALLAQGAAESVRVGAGASERIYQRHEMALTNRRGRPIGRAVHLYDVTHTERLRDLLQVRNAELESANRALRLEMQERQRAESRLRSVERLESVGRLAGGVAHDFNNLLTVMNGWADLLASRGLVDPRGAPYLDHIRQAGVRAAALTAQLLAFARRQPVSPKPTNLNGVVSEAAAMLKRTLGDDIAVETILHPGLHQTLVDSNQMHQVVLNLAVNARDAMPEGGKIILETYNRVLDASYAQRHPDVAAGEYVVLDVTDTGIGMDERTRSRIFEPFFTTKAKGQGTGLGLSSVHGIVRQSGGWIWVYSEPGKGTTFRLYFPRHDGHAERPHAAPPVAAHGGAGATILVVEDQPEVRDFAVSVLESAGFEVLSAADGVSAVRLAAGYPRELKLLVTDVEMPGMNGRQLADTLAAQRPTLKTLFVSGYSENVIVSRGVLKPGILYLPKPYSPDELVAKIREVLGGAAENVNGPGSAVPPPPAPSA